MSDSTLYNALEDQKIGYKVVRVKNSRSYAPATQAALQSFTYRVNHETRRDPDQSGAMAIFETLEQAEKFFEKFGDHILLVEYTESEEKYLWKKNPPSFRKNQWGGGYHAVSNGIAERHNVPDGTIFADSVYVLDVVK